MTVDIDINVASESEAFLCDNCPRIRDSAYETSYQLHRLDIYLTKDRSD